MLSQAVDKIRLFDSQLTPVHADLFQLSLCAKVFNPALKFLDVDITAISTTEVSCEKKYEQFHQNHISRRILFLIQKHFNFMFGA